MNTETVSVVEQELAVKEDRLPQAQVNESSAILTVIERMATMPDLDMDRVERMFALHEKMLDRQAEQMFNDALSRAHAKMTPVVANMTNDHTGKNYADRSAIHEALKPIWTAEGLSFLSYPGESEKPNYIKITSTLRHSGGHKITVSMDFPIDIAGSGGKVNKTELQAIGSSTEYGIRYLELSMMDISVKGKDNDGNSSGATIDEETAAWIKKELQDLGADVKAFCRLCKCDNVDSMSAKNLKLAKDFLIAKRKEKARGNP